MFGTDGQTFVYPEVFIFYFMGIVTSTSLLWLQNRVYMYNEGRMRDEAGEME